MSWFNESENANDAIDASEVIVLGIESADSVNAAEPVKPDSDAVVESVKPDSDAVVEPGLVGEAFASKLKMNFNVQTAEKVTSELELINEKINKMLKTPCDHVTSFLEDTYVIVKVKVNSDVKLYIKNMVIDRLKKSFCISKHEVSFCDYEIYFKIEYD